MFRGEEDLLTYDLLTFEPFLHKRVAFVFSLAYLVFLDAEAVPSFQPLE